MLDTRDTLDYRKVIGRFATGVSIITATYRGEPYGMTANSLTSVSLDPTLLLVCFIRGSKTEIAVKESGLFGVNLLDETQRELSNRFAATANDWGGVRYRLTEHGIPLLDPTIGEISCRVHEIVEGGDHEILIGEVTDFHAGCDADPLVFYQGRYRRLAPAD